MKKTCLVINMSKKLARNVDTVIAAESLKTFFDELITAGFTERQAIEYLATYVSKYAIYKDISSKVFKEMEKDDKETKK